MEGNIKLGYWAYRGRGQVPRLLLSYTGATWQDFAYSGPQKWFPSDGDKTKLGLEFPNLPYLIHGDFKLTESSAIAKYIARISDKKDLLGRNAQDQAKVQMVISLLDDIFNPTFALCFSPNYESQSIRIFQGKIKSKLDQLQAFIGQKQYTIGYLTVCDFKVAQSSHYFQHLYVKYFSEYKNIKRIQTKVQQLPEVQAYYQKKDSIKEPFLPDYSKLKF